MVVYLQHGAAYDRHQVSPPPDGVSAPPALEF